MSDTVIDVITVEVFPQSRRDVKVAQRMAPLADTDDSDNIHIKYL